MTENYEVNFQVGEFTVYLELKGSEIVKGSATGPDDELYALDFAFERLLPSTSGCKICRRVGTQYICQDIQCDVLVAAAPYTK